MCVCVAHVQCLLWDFDGTGGASDTKTVVTPGAAWADVLLEPGTSTLAKGHAHQRSLHCASFRRCVGAPGLVPSLFSLYESVKFLYGTPLPHRVRQVLLLVSIYASAHRRTPRLIQQH